MTRLLSILALAASALLPGIGPARAQVTVVDRCVTDVDPGGTNLADALSRGGRIEFSCPNPTTIQITRPHTVTRSFELDGGGKMTLDGAGATPFVEAVAPDLTLAVSNVAIRRMSSTNTSGVFDGDLGLKIVITNSQILESELPIGILRGEVIATDSLFEGNGNAAISAPVVTLTRTKVRATDGMPIFSRSGQVSITDSEFANNKSGSVFRGCSQVSVVRTTFADNEFGATGETEGGAAFVTTCDTTVENGTFTNNKSGANGGAIHIRGTAKRVRIQGSRFTGNSAARNGGAISMEPAASDQVVLVQHTIFKGNTARAGGALFAARAAPNGQALLTGNAVAFAGNGAGERGGAVATDGVVVSFFRTAFIRNAAPTGAAVSASAPPIAANGFVNSLFVLNSGAGGTFAGSKASFVNSTILGTTGPGLVQSPAGAGAEIRLSNTIVENNSGGNCVGDPAGFVNEGANLQFPGNSCGVEISVAAALLDTFYAPMIGGAARANGRDDVCSNTFVRGRDFYGKRRPESDHCSIGAVEGDMKRTIDVLQAWGPKEETDGACTPGAPSECECSSRTGTTVSVDSGSTPVEQKLAALAAIGIDFSVPEIDLKSWLDTPDFTPYPAISDALLELTRSAGLKCPVFIDVIVFNYENTPGMTSPRKLADVNLDVLKAAIVEGYNNRHGTQHSTFDELVGADACTPADVAACSSECPDTRMSARPVSSGATPVEQKLSALAAVGIDFSVPEVDLKSWLDTPEFTPYPAISDALLDLTRSRGLKCPVFIDVIVFNYESTSGVTSPRKLADVRLDVLQAAILEGYNNRHDTHHSSFDDLVR